MKEVLKRYLDDKSWKYSKDENESVFFFGISGVNTTIDCIANLDEEKKRFLFRTEISVQVPDEKMTAIVELLTRVNNETFLGNFEMNYETRRIQFRTSIVYESLQLTNTLLDHLIMFNIISIDLTFPAIQKILEEDQTPFEAHQFMKKQVEELRRDESTG